MRQPKPKPHSPNPTAPQTRFENRLFFRESMRTMRVTQSVFPSSHFLAVAIRYLLTHRPDWPKTAAVGKTLVKV